MTDTATQFRASVEAQARAQDLLAAGQAILTHGNRLFNNVHDLDAYLAAVEASTNAVRALGEFFKIVRAHDVEA